jgi:putative tryptophan/tyrosine transport system substrate-binding protein
MRPVMQIGSCRALLAVLTIAAVTALTGASRAAGPAVGADLPKEVGAKPAQGAVVHIGKFEDWFKYGAGIDKAWQISAVPGNPLQVLIHRRNVQAGEPVRRVFVLYPRDSSAYDIAITAILRVFEEKDVNAEMTVVNYETDDQKGAEALRLAQTDHSALIFAMGSESTAWLLANYRGGTIPVVTVCSKDPVQLNQMRNYDSGSGTNFAFTSLNMPVEAQMAYVLQLKKNLQNITILVDATNTSAVETQARPIADYAKAHDIQVFLGEVHNPENSREELTHIVGDAVKAMRKNDPELNNSLFWVTGSTSVFREIATINKYADRVPVVSVVPEVVKEGRDTAVLAIGISFDSNAHLAAIYGADILAGRSKPGELKVGVVSPPDIAISFLKVRELGMVVPFSFFESASFVYDYDGHPVRAVASQDAMSAAAPPPAKGASDSDQAIKPY